MIIRDVQMATLRDVMAPRFLERLAAHLRADLGDEVEDLDDDALVAKVGETVSRAEGHGLSTEADQASFTRLAAAFGWDFDQREAWVGEYLADPAITPVERLHRVKERCHRALAAAARSEAARAAFGLED